MPLRLLMSLALCASLGCADAPGWPVLGQDGGLADAPTRRSLIRALFEADTLTVVYPAEHPELMDAFRAGPLAGRWEGRITARFVAEDDLSEAARRGPLAWMRVVGAGEGALPSAHLETAAGAFALFGERYGGVEDVAALLVPSDAEGAAGAPLAAYVGGSAGALAEYLRAQRGLGPSTGSYAVYRAGVLQRTGFLSATWRYDSAHDRRPADSDGIRLARGGVTLRGALSDAEAETVATHFDSLRARLALRVGAPAPPLDVTVFAHAEDHGLRLGGAQRALGEVRSDTAHAAFPRFPGTGPLAFGGAFQSARALLVAALGEAAAPALADGIALRLAGSLYGASPAELAGRLARGKGSPPSLAEMLGAETYASLPPLVRWGYAGALVGFLNDRAPRVATLPARWQQRPAPTRALEAEWQRYLAQLAETTSPTSHRALPSTRLDGFNFAHQGYRVLDGYGSRLADAELRRIANLGATAVAVIPYTSMYSPSEPAPLRVAESPGGENDASIIHAARSAQAEGMRAIIKPQIWLRGSWPGDIDMQSEADWDTFFAHYTRWMQHYAILAEAVGAELLCLGVELGAATLAHPERWRRMAADIRALFGARLTYAANWGEEFERLAFWDALDVIGLDQYYPLSPDSAATDADLRAGAEHIVATMNAVQARESKPLLLTEVGYASRPAPWISPHDDGGAARYDGEAQARAARIFTEALRDANGLAGALWWKWPTTPEVGGPGHTRFTPRGKPAEAMLSESFER